MIAAAAEMPAKPLGANGRPVLGLDVEGAEDDEEGDDHELQDRPSTVLNQALSRIPITSTQVMTHDDQERRQVEDDAEGRASRGASASACGGAR